MYDVSLPLNNIAAIPLMMITVLSFILGLFIIWIAGIIACAKSDLNKEDKLVWLLIIIFLHALGAILYFALRPKDEHKKKTKGKRTKTLRRDDEHKVIAGVCAGIAKHFGMDRVAVRLLYVVLALITGFWPLLITYIVLWAVLEGS